MSVDEIEDCNIELLPVAMAAAYALLDALRVPGKIIVDDERAELKVETLGCRLGGNHD